jgi:diaminohydroxyphosphoribosylaminopyrimidine deaminase/5-amino-6-(5-phosphoribosylamino)uracil reductase
MRRALQLAALGRGAVEPNPMVGSVVAKGAEIIGEGAHRRFGGPHAEIEALRMAGPRARGATLYVTLEPCCHHGKTPPCTDAVVASGVSRVVIAQRDPFPEVSGGGIEQLRAAGLDVDVGVLEDEARRLNAPYLKLLRTKRPWIIAKWAMTLDGKIATRLGEGRWISGEGSRAIAHQIRGRVDAILVGRGTVEADDPLLTARPPGARTPVRVVLDTAASLAVETQLVRTAHDVPVIVVAGREARSEEEQRLRSAGCEVFRCAEETHEGRLAELLDNLGRRRMTNVLVEGGAQVLGSLFDAGEIDEVHVFIAPKLIGGENAPSALGGRGLAEMASAVGLEEVRVEQIEDDVYVRGVVKKAGEE